jgi:UDP-N-acetylmuramyl tripeptide synthase
MMEFLDSRRLTGPNLFWQRPGAAIEVEFGCFEDGRPMGPTAAGADRAIEVWQSQARRILAAVGWDQEELIWRVHRTGLSLAFSAPIDALYAACEVADWAWRSTAEVLAGLAELPLIQASKENGVNEGKASLADDPELVRIKQAIADEQDPKLLALYQQAQALGINFCGDDEWTTLGMGAHGQTWDTPDLPEVDQVDWDALGDIPCAMVTGTNGKSTTVRLLVAMVKAAGLVPGASSTDWIQVGDQMLDLDDWSGPGGARAVLKDPRVEVALLETARGGMLRRGLGLECVDVAVITNVAQDHLGEMGIHELADLTEVKFILQHAGQHLVLNADDPEVRRRGQSVNRPITWCSLNPDDKLVQTHLAEGGQAIVLHGDELIHCLGDQQKSILDVHQIPMTLNGAVRYNVSNAMAAIGAALQMKLPLDAIRQGLRDFKSDPESNPGRLNVFEFDGVRALVDFAHNPHGMLALFDTVSRIPHERMLILLGQAGDRDDNSIAELAQITAAAQPDRVIIKEMGKVLRGRESGEVAQLLHHHLRAHGLAEGAISQAPSEIDAVEAALEWAKSGDLLLLLSHEARSEVLARLAQRQKCAGMSQPGG